MNLVVTFLDVYIGTLFVIALGGWAFGGYAESLVYPKKHPSFLKYFLRI